MLLSNHLLRGLYSTVRYHLHVCCDRRRQQMTGVIMLLLDACPTGLPSLSERHARQM
jgi:hypothetical protein